MRPDLLVFDLDGTLIDSAPDLVASLQAVQARLGRRVLPAETIVAAIGAGVRTLIQRTSEPPHEPVLEAFLAHYGEHLLDRTKPYPDVESTLSALPVRKIILTNKPIGFTRRILDGLGLAKHFEAAYGGDSFPTRKPDVDAFRRAAGGAARPVMIGDSGVDFETARNAGADFVGVTFGYHKPGELDAAPLRIDRFAQLLDILR